MTHELMDLGDVAALYRCTRRHARDVIAKQVGFPGIAPGATERKPLWLTVEVRAFLYGGRALMPQSQDKSLCFPENTTHLTHI